MSSAAVIWTSWQSDNCMLTGTRLRSRHGYRETMPEGSINAAAQPWLATVAKLGFRAGHRNVVKERLL